MCSIHIPMEEKNSVKTTLLSISAPKRQRDDTTGEEALVDAKRLRADLLLDIIDDDSVEEDAIGDLADVMRSLEQEICLSSSSSHSDATPAVDEEHDVDLFTDLVSEYTFSRGSYDGIQQTELCYLLEASDDELGLPPTTTMEVASTSDEGEPAEDEFSGGQNWEFTEGMASDPAVFDLVFDDDEVNTADIAGRVVYFDDDQSDLLLSFCEFSEFISWMPVE